MEASNKVSIESSEFRAFNRDLVESATIFLLRMRVEILARLWYPWNTGVEPCFAFTLLSLLCFALLCFFRGNRTNFALICFALPRDFGNSTLLCFALLSDFENPILLCFALPDFKEIIQSLLPYLRNFWIFSTWNALKVAFMAKEGSNQS